MAQRRVVVTGLGMVSPLGVGVKKSWASLLAGESGIVSTSVLEDSRYDDIPAKVAGLVPRGEISDHCWNTANHFNAAEARRTAIFSQYALVAVQEALKDANWEPTLEKDLIDTGVCIGTGIGGFIETYDHSLVFHEGGYRKIQPLFIPKSLPNMAAGLSSIKFGFKGPNHSVSTACATGNNAIGDAYRFIKDDYAQVMLAGATEGAIHPLALGGFARAKSLSLGYSEEPHRASRPFDKDRDGFVLGEGAGILVLEELEHAKQRNAPIYAEISGYGLSSDAHHITAPAPDGSGAKRAMQLSLRGQDPNQIDYINAHATSTKLGDKIEYAAMKSLFCGNESFHVSSTKGSTGHLLGAAGAIEAIFTTLAIKHAICPPTLNLDNIDVDDEGNVFDLNFVANKPVRKDIKLAMSNSFGFGGLNTSITMKRYQN